METKEIIRNIREKNNLTQEQFAELIHVTRQAVSRWENGETQPDTEQLKTLSKEFGVSINTLLGSPQTLFCQCCGMPLSDDSMISHETDGSFNEEYCKWCYADGNFTYKDKDSLLSTSSSVICLILTIRQKPNVADFMTPIFRCLSIGDRIAAVTMKSKEKAIFLCFSLCLYYLCSVTYSFEL